jgi:hypothetical protein
MALISPILRDCSDGGYTFWCPGCDGAHHVTGGWTYNGNPTAPTFKPSINITWGHYTRGNETHPCLCKGDDPDRDDVFWSCGVCHFFIENGWFRYQGDCTHHLRGQVVRVPDWPKLDWHDG